jgi:hypothetical protein
MLADMAVQRTDHVGVVVADLEAATGPQDRSQQPY